MFCLSSAGNGATPEGEREAPEGQGAAPEGDELHLKERITETQKLLKADP